MARKFHLLFLLIGVWLHGHTQQPFSKNYQINEGLLSNYIYSVFQDSKGYIWMSSDVGVSRFDGQSFVHYNTSHGLPDNEVFSFCEDRAGRIWFATLNGKPGYLYNGVFHNPSNDAFLKRCQGEGMVVKLFEQADGRVVYCGAFKTMLLDVAHESMEQCLTDDGIVVAWENPGNSIFAISRDIGKITREGFQPIVPMLKLTHTVRVATAGDTLIVSSDRNLYFFERYSGKLLHIARVLELGNQFIFLQMMGNILWAGTRDGVVMFDYPSMKMISTYLPGHTVTSVLKDREGGLWFSTFDEGAFYIPDPNIIQYGLQEGLLYKRIICLSRDKRQRLWIGSEGSAFSILDDHKLSSRQVFPKNVVNKNIRNIRQMADGGTMVIGKAGTLIIRDGMEKLFVHRASDINIDVNGTYWAGLNALFEVPAKLASLKTIPASRASNISDTLPLYGMPQISRLKGHKVEKIEFDNQESVWIGTHSGLFAIHHGEKEVRVLGYSVLDMLFDTTQNILWVLSESNGLFSVENGRVTDSISIRNQFGEVICRDLCRAEDGTLWIASASGLFRVQGAPGALQLTSFRGVLGLGSDKINAVEAVGDQIYIGKDDGLLAVPKSILLQSPPSPPALIKSLRINNREQSLEKGHFIRMYYGQGSLSIEFEGLSYREPQYIRYRYRMAGLDTVWHETANEALEFASLRPGHYHFEVYTVNGAGETCAEPASVDIHVQPPFWMQAWFYLLMTAVLGLFIVFYIRWRERRLRSGYEVERQLMESSREKSELQKKNTDLKMLALRLQMNPHFIFNALNTIKGYYGQEKTVEANAFIGKFARLLRLNLDYSDALIPLDQEMSLLKIYLQLSQIRYPDKINFSVEVAPGIYPMDIRIPSMLLQPFVENAVIHGLAPKKTPGHISVYFRQEGDEIVASVRDTGVGRTASTQHKLHDPHKPLATQITIERLQLLRKRSDNPPLQIHDLYENGTAAGTEVVLYIPFQTLPTHD